MSEDRNRARSIIVKDGRYTVGMLELFNGDQWKNGSPDMFRVRLNGKWVGGRAKKFFDLVGIADLVARVCGDVPDQEDTVRVKLKPKPSLKRGDSVRVANSVRNSLDTGDRTRLNADPIQGVDGRWYAPVTLFGQGCVMICCDDMTY